jgi:hypothetical protein
MADDDDDDDDNDADDNLADANEDLAELVGEFEEDVADLKEQVDGHPDAALKAALQADVTRIEDALASMRSKLGGSGRTG